MATISSSAALLAPELSWRTINAPADDVLSSENTLSVFVCFHGGGEGWRGFRVKMGSREGFVLEGKFCFQLNWNLQRTI